jgi:hypothetical protein
MDAPTAPSHPNPTDAVLLMESTIRMTLMSCQCVYLLVRTVLQNTADIHSFLTDPQSPTPPAFVALQQPLFDMLRYLFAK